MLVSHIDRLLARTDPFDLSQAVELHVRLLSGDRIRALLRAAGPRLGAYYRDEFARLTGSRDFEAALAPQRSDTVLQSAFIKFLKSNLRAIPIFGSAFGLALLQHTPLDRAVGIGEERRNPFARAAMFGGAALALVLAGAAGEHVIAGSRAVSESSAPPLAAVPAPQLSTERPSATVVPPLPKRVIARVTHRAAPRRPAPQVAQPAPQTEHIAQAPAPVGDIIAPPPQAAPHPSRQRSPRPPAAGAAVVEVTAAPDTPTPEPTELDVSDMPEAYSNATPVPEQTAVSASVSQRDIHVATPQPAPKRRGWLRRTLKHMNDLLKDFDPFKPGGPGGP